VTIYPVAVQTKV